MKFLICFLFTCSTFFLLVSCNKIIEDKQKDLFIESMTEGKWYIHSYMEGTIHITEQFDGFIFQFYKNGTVTGSLGDEIKQGSWQGDISNYSITSHFSENPLGKLNGSWRIIDASSQFVRAEMISPSGKIILELKKA